MKANLFFAESITLENGATIVTGENAVDVTFADDSFVFSYRASGGEFDEVNPDFLNYEKLVAVLSVEDASEDDVSELMEASLESAKRHFGE